MTSSSTPSELLSPSVMKTEPDNSLSTSFRTPKNQTITVKYGGFAVYASRTPALAAALNKVLETLGGADNAEAVLRRMYDLHPQTVFDHTSTLASMHKWEDALLGLLFLAANREGDDGAQQIRGEDKDETVAAPAAHTQGELF